MVLATALVAGSPSVPAQADSEVPDERPKIALVLSGGGARGAAHAGVIKLLERHRVPVDFVAGTSFGALVGGLYASGMSPDEIIDWLEDFDWEAALVDRPPRRALSVRRKQDDNAYALRLRLGFRDGHPVLPKGLLSGLQLGFMVRTRTLHSDRWASFDDFPIPFRAIATDIERGERVILDDGPLADALLASMAVPGVVAPFEIDGKLLLDGGLVDNLPVDVVRRMGAEIVIAVDVTTPLAPRDTLEDVLGVSAQVINLVGQENMAKAIASLGSDDLLIRPDLSGIGAADFESMGEAIQRGLATGPVISNRLRALSLDETAWRAWVERQRMADTGWPVIDFIEIDNPTPIADALIHARITQETGKRLSMSRLQRDVNSLYSIGEFDRIGFNLVERGGRTGLLISVTANELGPNYLRFGLNIQDDLDGDGEYNFQVLHTRTQVNALNGEWRNEIQIGSTRQLSTGLFQPVTWRGDFFVYPRAEFARSTFDLFDAVGNRIARYRFGVDTLAVDTGWQWRNIGEVAVSAFREDVEAEPQIGSPSMPSFSDTLGGWEWRVTADHLDSWTFPADAWYFELRGKHASDRFGGVREFGRVSTLALWAWAPTDDDRIVYSFRGGTRTSGSLPLYEQFQLGGFLALSGLRQGELRGDHVFMTRLIYYRRLAKFPPALGDGFYVGLSHERGNVWNDRAAMGLDDLRWGSGAFLGADLSIGALYLGIGHADNGDNAGYLYLQRSFQ